MKFRPLFAAGILLWVAIVAWCGWKLLAYENTPGQAGAPKPVWPSASRIVRAPGQFCLVIFLHPDCPCSQASVTELGRLMAKLHGALQGVVIFTKPASDEKSVKTASLWKRVSAIPNVTSFYDAHGVEMDYFSGSISGETMLFDPAGVLVFHGGITASRGHEGDNEGSEAVIRSVLGESRATALTPVFGCSLRDPGAETLRKEPAWTKR